MKRNTIFIIIVSIVCAFWLMSCTSRKNNKETKMVTITNRTIQSKFYAKPDQSINFGKAAEHFQKYPERWNAAFKFLIESDLKTLAPGRIDLNEDVYAVVSEYENKNLEDVRFESHQEYIDLQYIISGEEVIGLTNDKTLKVISQYSEINDIIFYDFDGGKLLSASSGNYFIFFPNDIHKPCIKVKDKSEVKKIVIKIRYN